jgi:hypothetical protein
MGVIVRLEKALGAVLVLLLGGVCDRLALERRGWCVRGVQLVARAEQIWGVLPGVGGERVASENAGGTDPPPLAQSCLAAWSGSWGVMSSEAVFVGPLGLTKQLGSDGEQPNGGTERGV